MLTEEERRRIIEEELLREEIRRRPYWGPLIGKTIVYFFLWAVMFWVSMAIIYFGLFAVPSTGFRMFVALTTAPIISLILTIMVGRKLGKKL
jgi:hypothetical protein